MKTIDRQTLMESILTRYPDVVIGSEWREVDDILDAHVQAWNEGDSYITMFEREADSPEELDALVKSAHQDVADAVIREWLRNVPRDIAVGLVNGLMPYGRVMYAGTSLLPDTIADRWNAVHPDETPITRTAGSVSV